MHIIKSIGKEYQLPTLWEEVTVASFIEAQKVEDKLLPVFDQMKQVKLQHDDVLAEIEALFFSNDEFVELDIQVKNAEAADLEAKFNELQVLYNELSIERIAALIEKPIEELLTLPNTDIERFKAVVGMLYDEPFKPYQPGMIDGGVWMCKTNVPAFRNQSIKTVYYCRHLAEYPTCVHQVFHALIKKIRGLMEDARNERTEAELELISLFLMPRPTNLISYIVGDKPDKLAFDSGRFSELLNEFWERQKVSISQLPITFLKGVIGFFLPHWQIYFEHLNQTQITGTDTETY